MRSFFGQKIGRTQAQIGKVGTTGQGSPPPLLAKKMKNIKGICQYDYTFLKYFCSLLNKYI